MTTDVGDRYVLEALQREGGMLGGEQSGHIIYLRDHVTGDGLAAALLLCEALRGRTLAEAAAVMPRYPQAKENVRVTGAELPAGARRRGRAGERGARTAAAVCSSGRPGTEPVVRVLAEARRRRRRRGSVLASPRSCDESSADRSRDGGRREAGLSRFLEPVPAAI